MTKGPMATAVLAMMAAACGLLACSRAFVGGVPAPLGLRPQAVAISATQRYAEEQVDAEVLDADEMFEDDSDDEGTPDYSNGYPPEAYETYASDEVPDQAWFDRNKIDRHKVNTVFFDMFKKPKNFFPHELKPGDTVRVFYMEPQPKGDKKVGDYKSYDANAMREIYFDGIILNFKGEYQARIMTVRAMVGKGENVMGFEMQFPMHSPLVNRIEVLRRGYIGSNKNAYFMRAMVGKRNAIPLDKERTAMDDKFQSLIEEGKEDEIPESDYPQQEWDRYPLPVWKQDEDDWDEEKYAPELVDQRSEYERRVIARYRMRKKKVGGRFGAKR